DWGRLVPPGDPAALAEGIDGILALTAAQRGEMGAKGRAHIVEFCSVAGETRRLAELFGEVQEAARGTPLRR
ncbi:MAG: hypothetical protein M3Y34_09025, partial [Actinomycetota bacterium]|nr:hypothetical protein [Actinomycetota bacterium]